MSTWGRLARRACVTVGALAAMVGLAACGPASRAHPATSPAAHQFLVMADPVIFVYPPRREAVTVKVHASAGLSYSQPTYPSSGWKVVALPSGNLIDRDVGEQFPDLAWDANAASVSISMSSGFVVRGRQARAFLQKETAKIGLSPSEAAGFVSFWAPLLSRNSFNLIHFAGTEFRRYARLDVAPRPQSTLIVMMIVEPLSKSVSVRPQSFPTFKRRGLTVVEWGGGELS